MNPFVLWFQVDGPEEVTEELFTEALSPAKPAEPKKRFDRPTPPGKKGGRRLIK